MNGPATSTNGFAAPRAGRLVDLAKAHLVVVPMSEIGPLLASGGVRVDGRGAGINDHVAAGQCLDVDEGALANCALVAQDLELVVVHEDDDLIIVDKPAGMHVHPLGPHRESTVLNALLWHAGARPTQPWAAWRPAPMHRLDRAACGLVAFAKNAAVQDVMRRLFEAGGIERRYCALVEGTVHGESGTIDAPLGRDPVLDYRRAVVPVERGGQRAVTHWRVLERRGPRTTLDLRLDTGRTHQIRAHLASIGHPIVDDALYAAHATREDAAPAIQLQAIELRLPHPRTGELIVVQSPVRI